MNPLDFVPPGMGSDEPATLPHMVQGPQEGTRIPAGVRRLMNFGLVYVDLDHGVTTTRLYGLLAFIASLLDVTACITADVAFSALLGYLAGLTPFTTVLPAKLLELMPLWQLAALAGFLGAMSRPKVLAGVFLPSLRNYLMSQLHNQ